MANSALVNQRSLVNKETERLALMEERQKLMDELGRISKESVAGTKNAWGGSYQPNGGPLNWIYGVADRDLAKRGDKASARLQEINERLTNMNKEAPTGPLKQDTEGIKNFINSNSFKTGGGTSGGSTTKGATSKGNSNRGYWNANAVKQPEPTYVDSDGVTHTGMTQEEFDNSMNMYEIDNQGWYNRQRSKTIGESGMTADQMFKSAIDKFNANPDAFSDEQKKVLLNAGIQLGYYNRDGSPRKDVEIPEEAVQPSTATEPTRTAANPSIATTRTSNQGGTHVGYGGSGGEGYATDNDRRMQGGANSMFWSL